MVNSGKLGDMARSEPDTIDEDRDPYLTISELIDQAELSIPKPAEGRYEFTKFASGSRGVQTDMLQRPMFDDWPHSIIPRRCGA